MVARLGMNVSRSPVFNLSEESVAVGTSTYQLIAVCQRDELSQHNIGHVYARLRVPIEGGAPWFELNGERAKRIDWPVFNELTAALI